MTKEQMKLQLQFAQGAIKESETWTENQAGGWELIARGAVKLAEQLMEMLEEKEGK